MRTYVTHPPIQETEPGRVETELRFPAAERGRALAHRGLAVDLAVHFGVEFQTPFKLNPAWSPYREMTEGIRHGGHDDRRLRVWGEPIAVARYMTVLQRVIAQAEAAATRAARVFGAWRRSAQAEPHLEWEDACTLRVRARDFRVSVLQHLADAVTSRPLRVDDLDPSRPLWEQSVRVAAQVAAAGAFTLAPEDEEVAEILGHVRWLRPRNEASALPDTVEELLELAGPDDLAPREIPATATVRTVTSAVRIGASHGWRRRPLAAHRDGRASRPTSETVQEPGR